MLVVVAVDRGVQSGASVEEHDCMALGRMLAMSIVVPDDADEMPNEPMMLSNRKPEVDLQYRPNRKPKIVSMLGTDG